jgi:hypothetical protein
VHLQKIGFLALGNASNLKKRGFFENENENEIFESFFLEF